jgi:APA family basic amino acid/polyamine antiporter
MGLFSKKSLADLRAEAEGGQLRRSLGPWNLTALGIGSIIGTGIFVLTGTAASQNAGPALVLSMVISAIGCAFSGLCYAEFVATVAVGWSGYFVSLARDVGLVIPPSLAAPPPEGLFNLPATLIVLVVAGLLVIGIKQSADTNTLLVAIKALVLVLFVVAGASYVKRENLTPFVPPNLGPFGQFGWSGVLRGAGVMFFAYIGFDAVSTAAQEARNPARDMPIGILGSLAICTVLYMFVAVVLLGIVPYQRLNVADPLAVGIDATGITWLSPVIKVAALFGLFSTMLVQLLGQTRVFYSMSRDGLLPRIFAVVHPRFRTPHLSTMLTGIIIALMAGLTPITVLSQLVSIGTLLAFVLVSIGVIILRRTAPDLPRPFRTPGVPAVPILGAVFCLAQMVGLPLATWERLLIWLAIGFVVYFSYSRRSSALSAQGARTAA